jgi:hypothetical protein
MALVLHCPESNASHDSVDITVAETASIINGRNIRQVSTYARFLYFDTDAGTCKEEQKSLTGMYCLIKTYTSK